MSKKQLRPRPPIGTVIGIPLKSGGYAHAVQANGVDWWVYNFVTDALACDATLFPLTKWMQRYSLRGNGVGSKTTDEVQLTMPPEVAEESPTYEVLPEWVVTTGRNPTRYLVSAPNPDPKAGKSLEWYITEADLPNYQLYMMLSPKELGEFIEARREQMEFITLREDQKATPVVAAKEETTFNPGVIYEIWLSGLESMEVDDVEGIAEEIDEELTKHHAGEVIGTGGVDGEDQHNIAVESASDKDAQTLACIRRVLKRLKANPETTDIWRQDAPEKKLGLR